MKNVSFLIPTYSARPMLEQNLPAVLAASREGDEIIIVDDASSDDTVAWLTHTFSLQSEESAIAGTIRFGSLYKNRTIKVLINQSNQRFASSCNRGAAIATKDILLLLNNDVSPEPNFVDPLTTHFQEPLVFAVGCKELASNEGNREYGRSEGRFARGFYIHSRADDQNGHDTAWVAGGSGAFRKTMWDELNGFDITYKPAYWEDIDLSYRARKKGWQILFEPTSVVHHNHESTHTDVFGARKIEIMGFKNQVLFMWKNASLWQLCLHILWLPYHLVFTTLRTRGAFFLGFLGALRTVAGMS